MICSVHMMQSVFDGEDIVSCEPIGGVCRVLNIMVRRNLWASEVRLLRNSRSIQLAGDYHCFIVLAASMRLPQMLSLSASKLGDSLLIDEYDVMVKAAAGDDAVLIYISLRNII